MSIVDALTRIGQIQQQLTELSTGSVPTSTTGGASATPSTAATSTNFQSALAQAQGVTGSVLPVPLTGSGTGTTLASSLSPTSSVGGAALPAAAGSILTSAQQAFATRLAADTGLSPAVISAWLLAEESGGAAQSRQAAGNNDWLNVGYTDSGTYGSGDSVWSDPTTAADATAGWLKGQNTIPGYGTASSGVQAILNTVGQPASAQIAALQQSGWASGGYPGLPALYAQVTA